MQFDFIKFNFRQFNFIIFTLISTILMVIKTLAFEILDHKLKDY